MPILYGANSHEGSFVYGGNDCLDLSTKLHKFDLFHRTNFFMLIEISFIAVVYKDFILAANKSDDIDFLKFEFVDTLLRAVGIEQEYAFSDQIREKYFHEDQIGNLTAMTPGAIDVSTKFTSFKIIHCTYH